MVDKSESLNFSDNPEAQDERVSGDDLTHTITVQMISCEVSGGERQAGIRYGAAFVATCGRELFILSGNRNMKVVPSPTRLDTSIVPP